MRRIIFTLLLGFIIVGCQEEEIHPEKIVGRWKLVRGYDIMYNGYYPIDSTDQRMVEYTNNHERILYDYLGNETARCNYQTRDSTIIIFGENQNGESCEFDYTHWFQQDTLVIRYDGGFEFYNEYFSRIE